MTAIWYERFDGEWVDDVAPESYLNIGAVRLMRDARADRKVMDRAVGATPPEEIGLWPIYRD
jgi:hypothetical protein